MIDSGAELDSSAQIGPGAVIGPGVRIGAETIIGPYAVIECNTAIGARNHIFQFASIGAAPQDLKYKGEPSRVEIGDDNKIREFTTIHRGTEGGGMVTKIGNDVLVMNYVHIAHCDRLPDIESAKAARDFECEVEIGELTLIGRRTGHQTPFGKHIGHHRDRIDNRNTLGFDFASDRAEHRVVAPSGYPCKHPKRPRVGRERILKASARDSARHRGLFDAGIFERVDDLLQLADLDPCDLVHMAGEFGAGFADMGGCDHPDFAAAGGLGDLDWKDSVARDYS